MVRVKTVLRTDLGTHVEYVSPRMERFQALHYMSELTDAGHIAEIVYEFARPLSVREIVPFD